MRVAVISANLGAYDPPAVWPDLRAPEGVTVDVHRFTDENFPPRPLAMTSRLQCGIPKWFGWQMLPGYNVYVWIDASCVPTPDAVPWFLGELGSADIAVFRHPDRRTIREEYEFIVERMARPGETYLNSRYRGEWLHEQYDQVTADTGYVDDRLYASTAFVYVDTLRVTESLKSVWLGKTLWLLHDQLVFPYALAKSGCRVNVIEDNYLKCPALTYVRNKRPRVA